MIKKYQVFISSTYEDLKLERDQAIRSVLELGHIPVGMEMFSAADEEQWQIIARHIDESDYYIVIVAHRYGAMVDGVSFTRKEYEYALSRGIPILGFIIEDSALWPGDRTDSGENRELLEDFKDRVREKPVAFWSSADDLYGRVTAALAKTISINPRDGWVRASAETGPEVTAEISRLSSENAALRKKLREAERESHIAHESGVEKVLSELASSTTDLSYRYRYGDKSWQKREDIPLSALFSALAPALATEFSVMRAAERLAMLIRDDEDREADIVAKNQVQELFLDLAALGLVEPSTRKHSVNDNGEYWTLTPLGLDVSTAERRRKLRRRKGEAVPPEEAPADATASGGGADEGDT